MAMILEIIEIHLDRNNVVRLKEFENYKENVIFDTRSCTYPPRETYSKPETINVVLSPIELPPVTTGCENKYAYKVSHEIDWGSNGHSPEVLMRDEGYVYHTSHNNGMVWLTEREIGLLTLSAKKRPGLFLYFIWGGRKE